MRLRTRAYSGEGRPAKRSGVHHDEHHGSTKATTIVVLVVHTFVSFVVNRTGAGPAGLAFTPNPSGP